MKKPPLSFQCSPNFAFFMALKLYISSELSLGFKFISRNYMLNTNFYMTDIYLF